MQRFAINTKVLIYFWLILLFGLAIRFLLLLTPLMDSDQAVNGLMACHITQGALPPLYYGQDYCGSIETYFISSFFFLFGISRFTLDLTICVESLFFIILVYYLAALLFDKATALLSALLSAFGSYYLYFHSVLARSAYIEIPIIGVLLFIFAYKIIYHNKHIGRYYFCLGLMCGLGIWTHYLIIFYFPPIFLLLFIRDKWFWGWRTIFSLLLGLGVGGLPLWVHNIRYPLITWHYLWEGSGGGESFLSSLKDFFFIRFPELLGVINNETQQYCVPYLSPLFYLICLGLFCFLLLSRRKGFFGLVKLRINQSNGLDLLLLFLFLFPVIFALSGFASNHTGRYLMPLFSVLPILFAVFARQLISFSPVLAFLFVLLHLFSNVSGTLPRIPFLSENQARHFQEARKKDQVLFNFLKEKKIRGVYSPEYWNSVQLTFDAREEIIFAQPVGDRYRQYSELVDRDPGPAFLFSGDNKDFEDTLKHIGGAYRKSQVSGYSIYHDFVPPPYRTFEINPAAWKGISNYNLKDVVNSFDRDDSTRWASGEPQKPGMFLQIDLGKSYSSLAKMTLLFEKAEDFPRDLRLEISSDGKNWKVITENLGGYWGALFWSGPHPFARPQEGRIDLAFSPQAGRFLKMTLLREDKSYQWSIDECFIYQAGPRLEKNSGALEPLISRIKQKGLIHLYTTPWIKAQLPPELRADDGGILSEKQKMISPFVPAVFVVEKEKAGALAAALKDLVAKPFQTESVDDYVIFSLPPQVNNFRKIFPKGWQVHTNYNPQEARLAIDGKIKTRWTSKTSQVPGMTFQVDLGEIKELARLKLLIGDSLNDFPRGVQIKISVDGRVWKTLPSTLSSGLVWTGENLLKDRRNLDLIFPSTPVRYLHIVQTAQVETYYWSIHEIELYERSNP